MIAKTEDLYSISAHEHRYMTNSALVTVRGKTGQALYHGKEYMEKMNWHAAVLVLQTNYAWTQSRATASVPNATPVMRWR